MKLTKILTATAIGSALAFSSTAMAAETGKPKQSVGEYTEDAVITTKVKAAIVKAKDLSALDIAVNTVNGTVELSGTVASTQQAESAAKVAHGIKGVKHVVNLLKIDAAKAG